MPLPRRSTHWLALIAATVTALAAVVLQQIGQVLAGRNPLQHLRTEFWHDQLGYLAIAADVAHGHFDNSEPVTMTGISYYPRFYYSAVGFLARITGLPTIVSWNLTSFALQFLAVLAVALVVAAFSRRWWLAFAGGLPFFTGTFAYAIAGRDGAWYTLLDGHAVMWGPYGVLFSNNAETAGLCVGIIAVSGLLWVWRPQGAPRARIVVTLVAAALIGALSSFQTYSFLAFTYVGVFAAAIAGIFAARRKMLVLIASVVLVVAVFALGPIVADRVGQLPTLVFGMIPALPGLVVAIVRTRGLVALAGVVAVGAALPQVLYTMLGALDKDPFLTYRVASNHLLGVFSWQALVGSSVVLVGLLGVLVVALRARDRFASVIAITALVVLPLLAVNDLWGANAEPYRFWIEAILLGGITVVAGFARLVGLVWTRSDQRANKRAHHDDIVDIDHSKDRSTALALVAALSVTAVLWIAAFPDWVNSLRDDEMQAAWNPYSERENAASDLARMGSSDPSTGLVTTERCIDNRTVKANSGAPIANYHLGMAWPDHRDAIDDIVAARDADQLDFDAMRRSDTEWVLTDSNCTSDWEGRYLDRLERVGARSYQLAPGETISAGTSADGTLTLWRVRGQ
ncbi:hypothetical protein [uncultured Microbacterium sp.]|uniref:hypothetical protein n=1 Tax=uncultured Microbacterium sp. TaxID=191216 RepID=UPI0028D829A9|nr:hypothetical protein [uncultured Microbacterium sp.]